MYCKVRVYLINDDFSQEYADQHNQGKESELNRLYEWEDELDIKQDVESVQQFEGAEIVLQGTMPNGEAFSEEVKDMRKFVLFDKQGAPIAQIACSEELFDRFEEERSDLLELKLFLRDRMPLSNPIPGIDISASHYPKSLIFE